MIKKGKKIAGEPERTEIPHSTCVLATRPNLKGHFGFMHNDSSELVSFVISSSV